MQSTEQFVIEDARGGSEEAFEELIRPWVPRAYRAAFAMLGSQAEAEDAVQEAMLKAWRRLENVREGCEMGPWFLGIVANQCRSLRRARWWSVLRFGEIRREEPSAANTADLRSDLERALAQLTLEQRQVITLRYYLDWDYEAIGQQLGISAAAAKSRLHRALSRLRPYFEVEGAYEAE